MNIHEFNNYSLKENKIIYLAVPYSAKTFAVSALRAQLVTVLSGELVSHGIFNFSPITQSHEQQIHADLPTDWDFWETHDCMFLDRIDEVWVYALPGWRESKGVTAEIKYALEHEIPVRIITRKVARRLGELGELEVFEYTEFKEQEEDYAIYN